MKQTCSLPRWARLVGAWLILAPAARAQSAETRAVLESFRDSLAGVSDSNALRTIERRTRQAARADRGEVLLELCHGLATLRLATVADGRMFDRARDAFARAARLAPSWPYPQFGVGMAEAGKGAWLAAEPANLGTRVGHGPYHAAIVALIAANHADSTFSPALLELGRIAGLLRDTSVASTLLNAYRRSADAGQTDLAVLLERGRVERWAGNPDSAVSVFERYLSSGGTTGLGLLEIARTRLGMGSAAGDTAYYAGASSNDSTVVREYRADLLPIADERALGEFDESSGPRRTAFLRRFWTNRDRRDLRGEGERLREHYRRLLYARRHFPLTNNRRYYGTRDLYRALNNEVDDRGVVYVRQGEPSERLAPRIYGLMPNESWVYRRAEGDLLLHFSAGGGGTEGGDLEDYRLVPSVLDLRGSDVPGDLLLLSRASVSDLYDKMMAWGPYGAARAAASERAIGEASAAIGTRTDEHELRFRYPLRAIADLVNIGRAPGGSLLHVIYAVPLTSADTTGDQAWIPVRIRLALFASDQSAVKWLDTTDVIAVVGPRQLGGFAVGRVSLAAPAGTWTYRLAIQRGAEMGIVLSTDSVVIGSFTDSTLSISDLGVSSSGASAIWLPTPRDTALLNPFPIHPPNSQLEVYYEVYGLSPGELYQTSIAVHQRRRGRTGPTRLRFSFMEPATGDITRPHRSIRLTGLSRGAYRLEVTIRDTAGQMARVFRDLEITHGD